MTNNTAPQSRLRSAALMLAALLMLAAFAGCGDDKDSGAETGKGAPPGVTGDEAGGFTVEAGKQRDPKDIAEEKKNFSDEPPPIQILSGDDTGYRVKKPTVVIARTAKEFAAMRKKHFTHGVKRENTAPIDFKDRQIVALFMPEVRKGTLIVIIDVHEAGGGVVVKATRLLPGKGCKTAKFKPHPFHMVETREMKGNPKLQLEDTKSSPC